VAGQGGARLGKARQGKVFCLLGLAGRGEARQGAARQGKARQGNLLLTRGQKGMDYQHMKIGDCITVANEGIALAAVRWATRHGQKFSRQKMNDGISYQITRIK
jgi:hypothetical protein